MVTLHVGTSGWQYGEWRNRFYPAGVSQREWLAYYAARFATVEVDGTFYRLPDSTTFASWAARTPGDFVLAPKMSRFLTHVKRLGEPGEPLARFFENAAPLGDKLGPVLVQLPPNLALDRGRLDALLAPWPNGRRLALEPRHPSWFDDDVLAHLAEHDVALCLTDRRGRPVGPVAATTSWGYVRFHEGAAAPRPCYGDAALASWVDRIATCWGAEGDVFAYFDNDTLCCAVRDAVRFAARARRAGLAPTRVPDRSEIRAG